MCIGAGWLAAASEAERIIGRPVGSSWYDVDPTDAAARDRGAGADERLANMLAALAGGLLLSSSLSLARLRLPRLSPSLLIIARLTWTAGRLELAVGRGLFLDWGGLVRLELAG